LDPHAEFRWSAEDLLAIGLVRHLDDPAKALPRLDVSGLTLPSPSSVKVRLTEAAHSGYVPAREHYTVCVMVGNDPDFRRCDGLGDSGLTDIIIEAQDEFGDDDPIQSKENCTMDARDAVPANDPLNDGEDYFVTIAPSNITVTDPDGAGRKIWFSMPTLPPGTWNVVVLVEGKIFGNDSSSFFDDFVLSTEIVTGVVTVP
jgi:hypothetical protein